MQRNKRLVRWEIHSAAMVVAMRGASMGCRGIAIRGMSFRGIGMYGCKSPEADTVWQWKSRLYIFSNSEKYLIEILKSASALYYLFPTEL